MAEKTKIEKRLSKPEKVTKEELNKIQALVGDMNKGQFNLGNLELQKHRILHAIGLIQEQFGKVREELKKEYGSDDVNIETGVINYNENGEADKKD
tara:strand:- start:348 stop:635 length:288 start_codon:yes stop_codon:yes gene_type:complete